MAAQEGPQPQKGTDLRIRKTRKALQEALVSLISEKGFDAVTVQDIAERAMVNRSTFYRHFRDKYDLMRWGMEQVFADLAWQPVPPNPADFSFEDAVHHTDAVLTRIAQHASFCQAMFAMERGSPLTVEVERLMEQVIDHRLQITSDHRRAPLVPEEMVIPMVINGWIGLLNWWLQRGMPYSPREMAVQVVRLFSLGPYRCLGLESLAESGVETHRVARGGGSG